MTHEPLVSMHFARVSACRVSRLGPRGHGYENFPRTVFGIGPWYRRRGGTCVRAGVVRVDSRLRERRQKDGRAGGRGARGAPRILWPRRLSKHMDGGERPDIKPAEPPIVYFDQDEDVGSILIDTQGRKLYYVLPGKRAYQYPISVGRDGFTWSGTERISRIAAWPSWTPPAEMHKRQPGLPITVTGGLKIRRARARSISATPSIASTAPTMIAP